MLKECSHLQGSYGFEDACILFAIFQGAITGGVLLMGILLTNLLTRCLRGSFSLLLFILMGKNIGITSVHPFFSSVVSHVSKATPAHYFRSIFLPLHWADWVVPVILKKKNCFSFTSSGQKMLNIGTNKIKSGNNYIG